jgi:hypothetical protein
MTYAELIGRILWWTGIVVGYTTIVIRCVDRSDEKKWHDRARINMTLLAAFACGALIVMGERLMGK